MKSFSNTEKDALRADEIAMRKEVEMGGGIFKGKNLLCIFHEEKNPSATIYFENDAWHYHCFGCSFNGDIFDVRAKLKGTKPEDELRALRTESAIPSHREQREPRAAKESPPPTVYETVDAIASSFSGVEAVYRYTDPTSGKIDLAVIRYIGQNGKKRFCQCRPVSGGFVMGGSGKQNPLYNRSRVAGADTVIVVEGERCVHALHDAGFVGTTSPQGAESGDKADWTPLAGKRVILWPDNDYPQLPKHPQGIGITHMRTVQKILERLIPPPTILWLDPTGFKLGEGGDVADVVSQCKTAEEKYTVVSAMLEEAEPIGVSVELRDRIEETIAGKRLALPMGDFGSLAKFSRALIPGTVTCLCGDPGTTKSFWLLQMAIAWHQSGVKACLYELEEDRSYHMQRALAQIEYCADLTDSDWVQTHPIPAREAISRQAEFFDSFGRTIWEAPDELVSLEMLKEWVRARAESGYEIIAIDPITAAESEEKPWMADLDFLMSVKTTARRYGCRVVLVTHPKKGGKTPSFGLDALAGGAAYQRFSQTVLWLVRHDPPVDVRVQPLGLPDEFRQINRGIRIIKARNGRGAGTEIGFNFDIKTLRFTEAGVVFGKTELELTAEELAIKHGV